MSTKNPHELSDAEREVQQVYTQENQSTDINNGVNTNNEVIVDANDKAENKEEITAEMIAEMSEEDLDKVDLDNLEEFLKENSEESNENIQSNDAINNINTNNTTGTKDNLENTDNSNSSDEANVNVNDDNSTINGMSADEFYKKVTSPFRANNSDVQVTKAEDVIRLMQMGMNYQKKMASLKPHLKTVKALELANLTKPDDINMMIDLMNKKPEAIASLIKATGMDSYELDDLREDYVPENHQITDNQYNLHEAIEDLKNSETGNIVLNNVQQWDEASKNEIYENPDLLRQLNEQVNSGLFNESISIINRDIALGKLQGISMIDAYQTVATQLLQNKAYARPKHWNDNVDPNMVNSNASENTVQAQNTGNVQGTNLQHQENNYQQGYQQNFQQQRQNVPNQQNTVNPNSQYIGNNLQEQNFSTQNNNVQRQKKSAGIPNNASQVHHANLIDATTIANMSEEDIDKIGSFEEFVAKVQFKK